MQQNYEKRRSPNAYIAWQPHSTDEAYEQKIESHTRQVSVLKTKMYSAPDEPPNWITQSFSLLRFQSPTTIKFYHFHIQPRFFFFCQLLVAIFLLSHLTQLTCTLMAQFLKIETH